MSDRAYLFAQEMFGEGTVRLVAERLRIMPEDPAWDLLGVMSPLLLQIEAALQQQQTASAPVATPDLSRDIAAIKTSLARLEAPDLSRDIAATKTSITRLEAPLCDANDVAANLVAFRAWVYLVAGGALGGVAGVYAGHFLFH